MFGAGFIPTPSTVGSTLSLQSSPWLPWQQPSATAAWRQGWPLCLQFCPTRWGSMASIDSQRLGQKYRQGGKRSLSTCSGWVTHHPGLRQQRLVRGGLNPWCRCRGVFAEQGCSCCLAAGSRGLSHRLSLAWERGQRPIRCWISAWAPEASAGWRSAVRSRPALFPPACQPTSDPQQMVTLMPCSPAGASAAACGDVLQLLQPAGWVHHSLHELVQGGIHRRLVIEFWLILQVHTYRSQDDLLFSQVSRAADCVQALPTCCGPAL